MQDLLSKFSEVKVLVIGDLMLDQYWWGDVQRISPEAPVPIVNLKKKSTALGGAANVAANVKGLGAKPFLIGGVGSDSESKTFFQQLTDQSISKENVISLERLTTVKTRIIAQNQQVVRVDQEKSNDLSEKEETALWEEVEKLSDLVDIVLISDYAKGVISDIIAERLITLCKSKNIKVIVDPKGKDYKKYKNATVITPNNKEAFEASNSDQKSETKLNNIGNEMLENLNLQGLLITRGEKGMTLFRKGREVETLASTARKVFDVTGAGDTVISAFTVAIGAGFDFLEAAKIANTAAGLVVEKVGTTSIDIYELEKEIARKDKKKY